jgi:hypothetical protein
MENKNIPRPGEPVLETVAINTQKEQRWQQVVVALETTKDRSGLGIDKGVFETVAALNILDINTKQSCEGHLERGIAAPWIDVEVKETEGLKALKEQLQRAMDDEERAEQEGVVEEELARLYAERQRLQKEVQIPQLREIQKTMQHLAAFYESRQVPYDRRIVMVHGRMQSQGAELQQIASPEIKQQKLQEYQAEMRDFTAFLKAKYFAS